MFLALMLACGLYAGLKGSIALEVWIIGTAIAWEIAWVVDGYTNKK